MHSLSPSLLSATLLGLLCMPSQQVLASHYTIKRSDPVIYDGDWLASSRDAISSKYGSGSITKRQASGSGILTNYQNDVAYYIPAQFGTPPKTYNVLLDTGSADLWLASSTCTTGCQDVTVPYVPGQGSSTFNDTGAQPFSISYLGGDISGTTVADTVSMVGLTVEKQTFGVITSFQGSVVVPNVTGLMGLGFDTIAQIAIPWWEHSAKATPWAQPLFAFSLLRQGDTSTAEKGGTFSIGQLDTTAFQGDVDYIDIPSGRESWWLIPVTQIGIGSHVYSIDNAGSPSLAAIDTATTLIGGPPSIVRQIYSQIPQAQAGTGQNAGYYLLPCDASVEISFSFGGKTWPMNSKDFLLETSYTNVCVGAIFEVQFSGGQSPQWVIGDAFLKNVYSVYRYNPPSVGFAALKGATTPSGDGIVTSTITGSVPTGTGTSIGVVPATAPQGISLTASPSQSAGSTSAAAMVGGSGWTMVVVPLTMAVAALWTATL